MYWGIFTFDESKKARVSKFRMKKGYLTTNPAKNGLSDRSASRTIVSMVILYWCKLVHTVLLEMFFAWGNELNCNKLKAARKKN